MTTQPTHEGEVYTFHIMPSTPEARERIADGAEKPELLCRESAVTYNGKSFGRVVCGWGANLRNDRRDALAKLLARVDLSALKVNANGSPAHPLYQRSDLLPRPFIIRGTNV